MRGSGSKQKHTGVKGAQAGGAAVRKHSLPRDFSISDFAAFFWGALVGLISGIQVGIQVIDASTSPAPTVTETR